MAIQETPRHKFKKYGSGADAHPDRATFNAEVDKLEALPAIKQGSTGNRPLSGVGKVLYWDEAVKRFVYDDGSDWQDVAPIGGVTPSAVAAAGAASEGVSPRAARADHTHPLPLATSNDPGAMSADDKKSFDARTSLPTASTVMLRNTQGRAQVAGPALPDDVANKKYVDDGLAGKSATGHAHAAATPTAPGFMSPADKAKLDVIAVISTWLPLPIATTSFTAVTDNPPMYRTAYGRTEFAGSVTCGNTNSGEIIAANAMPTPVRPHDRTKVTLTRVSSITGPAVGDTTIVGLAASNGRLEIALNQDNVGKIICLDTMVWNRN